MDNGPLTKLKKTIVEKDKKAFIEAYNDTLSACYACHKSSYKPYLRPQFPKAPEVRVINFGTLKRQNPNEVEGRQMLYRPFFLVIVETPRNYAKWEWRRAKCRVR